MCVALALCAVVLPLVVRTPRFLVLEGKKMYSETDLAFASLP